MSHMHPDRAMARRIAKINGYFWLPCPACGQHFGGHEWFDVGGHRASIPTPAADQGDEIRSTGICPDCTATGVGCRAQHDHGRHTHPGCEFLVATTPQPEPHHEPSTQLP